MCMLSDLITKDTSTGDISFLKIHATWGVLARYAEALRLKMPLKVLHFSSYLTSYIYGVTLPSSIDLSTFQGGR